MHSLEEVQDLGNRATDLILTPIVATWQLRNREDRRRRPRQQLKLPQGNTERGEGRGDDGGGEGPARVVKVARKGCVPRLGARKMDLV